MSMFSEFFKQEASMSNRRLATVFLGESKEHCTLKVHFTTHITNHLNNGNDPLSDEKQKITK